MNFPYPPLPLGVDAIRILTLEPGDFYDPLIGTLILVTFESKPKYVALSYTWSDSYTDNARLFTSPRTTEFPHTSQRMASILPKGLSKYSPGISRGGEPSALTLNDSPCHLGHNLHLALLHLRSLTSPLTLWIDAICINQVDIEERNAQVALMSFIYMRAMKVVAWLGTKDYGNHLDPFHCMSIDWKAGQAPQFAVSLAGATTMRCSAGPDRNTLARITESSYWTRIWIVQELCLPRLLVFIYGACIWAYEDFRECNAFKAARTHSSHSNSASYNVMLKPMLQLFVARDTRNTKSMGLESLMEQFATNGCAELRDRVYGLLGLANNVRAITRTNDTANHVEKYINPLYTLPKHKKDLGMISIDYTRSFYDIWTDVVISIYSRAEGIEEQIGNQSANAGLNDSTRNSRIDEGQRSVVRTAGIVQRAFDQMVEEDVINLELYNTRYPQNKSMVTAIGFISAKVIHIGPIYRSLIASFQTHQDWVNSWDDHYNQTSHLEMLRRKNEIYTARIMIYEETEVARVRNIQSPSTVGRIAVGSAPESSTPRYATNSGRVPDVIDNYEPAQSNGPRICLGTNGLIGLVPPAAKAGDFVVQFWNCSAAIIMRPTVSPASGSSASSGPISSLMLVGRADVAEAHERKGAPEHDTHVAQRPSATYDPMFEDSHASGVVHVDLDLRTLQLITASISTF